MQKIQGSRSSTGRTAFSQGIISAILSFFVLFASFQALAMPAEYAVGPDSNLELLLKTFDSAKSKIVINIYEFDHPEIADHLVEKIREGIDVTILFETQPCCDRRMTPEEKAVVRRIHSEMKKSGGNRHRIYLMGSRLRRTSDSAPAQSESSGTVRRYNFNHAKYVVVDNLRVHVASENFTLTGHAFEGRIGNRGWDVAVENADLAAKMMAIFKKDTASGNDDVILINPATNRLPGWLKDDGTASEPEEIPVRTQTRVGVGYGSATQVELVTSPNAMPGIAKFMSYADERLDLQFMSLPTNWGRGANMILNPIVDLAIDLAKKGVEVRMLLNNDRAFEPHPDPTKPKANELTVAYLRKIAQCRNLPIDAKIVNVETVGITYIHNKGIIVDHDRVFVSSVNGTQNAVENNRETALAVRSTDANAYFSRVFDSDWAKTSRAFSDQATQAARATITGCPPVNGEAVQFQPSTRVGGWVNFY